MNFQRARTENQIKDRIKEIVDATSSLYSSTGYEALNFSIISEYTNFSRQNIYKYFKTKDEIFLLILMDDFKEFISDLTKSFRINKIYSLHEISEIWTVKLLEHEKLLSLYGILYSTIEKNSSIEALANFKIELIERYEELSNFVKDLFPNVEKKDILSFIYSQLTVASGIYSLSNINNIQKEAIKLSGVIIETPDFKSQFMEFLYQQLFCLTNFIRFNK